MVTKAALLSLCLGLTFIGCGSARADESDPLPNWKSDPATCHEMTEAILTNRVNDATDAVTPDNATHRLRMNVHALMQQLADQMRAGSNNRPAEKMRVLPDADLDGAKISVDVWSFGDQPYLVGCLIRPSGVSATISIQAAPTMDGMLDRFRSDGDGAASGVTIQ